ncbi:MAG: hypothetical protein AVO33_09220 [delta proteobacterium ML8_F1]|nr:MAG: hypothetical protein AVO33_09220 [delta proteobacterium ML8_F1]
MDTIRTIEEYLGYPGGSDPETRETIEKIHGEMTSLLKRKCVYETFKINSIREDCVDLSHPLLALEGKSIAEHLKGCEEVALLACTLGQAADRMIQLKNRLNAYEGLVADATASVVIETVCDECEEKIKQAFPPDTYFRSRFSPGYGDMPLKDQKPILGVLDAYKKIGLSLNDSLLLVPLKSIVAVLGISSRVMPKETVNRCGQPSCEGCAYVATCHHRKDQRR